MYCTPNYTVKLLSGYGEVSVDTDYGKIFSVSFAFLGIPLMFITAADIGKFLSETLLQMVNQWKRIAVSSLTLQVQRILLSQQKQLIIVRQM